LTHESESGAEWLVHAAMRDRVESVEDTVLEHEGRIGRVEGKMVILIAITTGSFAGILALVAKQYGLN
jgi:hypothetical protein